MKALDSIRYWMREQQKKSLDVPAFIPLSRDDIEEIISDSKPYVDTRYLHQPMVSTADGLYDREIKLFGVDVFETPFAVEMRQRQIDMPIGRVWEHATVSTDMFSMVQSSDVVDGHLRKSAVARVCHDTTHIKITLEWDSLAKWKRRLRLTRWWPVRKRTVQIEGRVLYPYLKISLPHNRHHVTFIVR